jgi:hypothetical protein
MTQVSSRFNSHSLSSGSMINTPLLRNDHSFHRERLFAKRSPSAIQGIARNDMG